MHAALIGYGSVGQRHARSLALKFPSLAIVDPNPRAREAAKERFPQASVLASTEELWRLDWPWGKVLVIIATWGPSHYTIFHECTEQGVRRVICEKPLADSLYDGWRMLQEAKEKGVTLGVNHTLRFLGVDAGLRRLAEKHGLGSPRSAVIHGGASGLVTNGIHYVDLAMALFGDEPTSVISTAVGDPINPRSPALMFYGGTAVWRFRDGREAVISFSNQSGVYPTAAFYFRNAVIHLHDRTHAEVLSRDAESISRSIQVTRTGPATERLFSGPVPGVLSSMEDAFARHYDEVVSESTRTFHVEAAYRALEACIGALIASEERRTLTLPIDPQSEHGRRRWAVS